MGRCRPRYTYDDERRVCVPLCGPEFTTPCRVYEYCDRHTSRCSSFCYDECKEGYFCDKHGPKCEPCNSVCVDYRRKHESDCRIHCNDEFMRRNAASTNEQTYQTSIPVTASNSSSPSTGVTPAFLAVLCPILVIFAIAAVALVKWRRSRTSRMSRTRDAEPQPRDITDDNGDEPHSSALIQLAGQEDDPPNTTSYSRDSEIHAMNEYNPKNLTESGYLTDVP